MISDFLSKKAMKTKLIATTLVVISFGYFYIEGPLEVVAKHLRFDHELTEFAIPKLVKEKTETPTSHALVDNAEIDGFGHSLLVDHHKPQLASFGLITKPEDSNINSKIIKRLTKHAHRLYDKSYTFKTHKNAEAPFIEIQKDNDRFYYIETKEHTEQIRGYAGPLNIGIVYNANGEITSLEHISSEETSSYLDKIVKAGFYTQFSQLQLNNPQTVDGVSGATITTTAISQNCTHISEKLFPTHLGNYVDVAQPFSFSVTTIFSNSWMIHIGVITLLFFYGFQKTIIKKSKLITTIVRLISIAYIGFYLNNSFTYTTILHPFVGVSLSILSGAYLFLTIIGAIWGKNIYCKYVCPFGNTQCIASQYTGKKLKTKFFLSDKWLKSLRALISLSLVTGIIMGYDKWKNFEPFPDTFGLNFISLWFFIAAFIVLISIRYPMLWCRSLCPTGWFLDGISDISNHKIKVSKLTFGLNKQLIIVFTICSMGYTQAQQITVLDEANNTMPYSHIIQHDSTGNKTALTDENGKFDIHSNHPTRIRILVLGYKQIDTLVLPQHNYSFVLTPDVQVLNEVVITAQFAANSPEKAVHQIKIIDKKRIEAQGANTLEDLLSNETNIRLKQDNILGSSLTMQGVSGQNLKILIDGIPVIGRVDGNIDLAQINLNNAERIEVIEGPLSVSYGSNALAGTINIITKKDQDKKVETSINSYYESIGRYNLNASSGFKKKKHYVNLSIGRNYFDGWSSKETERTAEWKPKRQYVGKGQYVRKEDNTTYRITSELFNEKISNLGEPRYISTEVNTFDDYYYTSRFDNSLNVNHYFDNNSHFDVLTAYNYYQRTKNRYFKDLVSLNENLTNGIGDQDTSRFGLIMSRGSYATANDSSKINYQIGYDLNIENAWGARIVDETQTIGDYALFSNIEWQIHKNIIIRPGIRASYNTNNKAPLTPSVNIKYSIKQSAIRFSYARGFRAPSIKDLYFDFVDSNHDIHGNEDLKAEVSHNFQSSWKWEKKIKHNIQLRTTLSAYYNYINNLITLTQSVENSTYYQNTNIGSYKSLGPQFSLQLLISHWKITTNATYNGQSDDLSNQPDVPEFVFSPEYRTNIMYDLHKPKITFSLFYKYNGKSLNYFLDSENNTVKGYIDGYSMMDFTISKSLGKNKFCKISLGTKNIFNVKNITTSGPNGVHSGGSNSSPQATGISFFTKISLQL